ncbi:MAG: hypothetical protein NTX54_04220 [Chloroflexi bacterium]|nr:hypothetical protein [Chloroflexota bacterium]
MVHPSVSVRWSHIDAGDPVWRPAVDRLQRRRLVEIVALRRVVEEVTFNEFSLIFGRWRVSGVASSPAFGAQEPTRPTWNHTSD